MLTQTWAIFHDSYRDLNAKKLFWIVLIISALIVIACGVPSIDAKGFYLLGWHIADQPNTALFSRAFFYKSLFEVAVNWWLTGIGAMLALISVAGIFPDLVAGGAVELVLSKPISRLRLFLTKYAAGLLFVTLQTVVFTVACFAVMGLRGGVWMPRMFVAIPLVLVFFSYLYAVCVLMGTLTRSTIAALLLTLAFWALLFGMNAADGILMHERADRMARVELAERQAQMQVAGSRPVNTLGAQDDFDQPRRARTPTSLADDRKTLATLVTVHDSILAAKTLLPKTADTVRVLDRVLARAADLPDPDQDPENQRRGFFSFFRRISEHDRLMAQHIRKMTVSRSLGWIIGTSLLFEAATVAGAAWSFCRRDF